MWKAQVLTTLKGTQMVSYINLAVQPPSEFLPPKDNKKEDKPPVKKP